MMHTTPPDIFHSIPCFAALPPAQRHSLLALCTARDYAPQQAIFAYGDPGDALYLVAHGAVEVFTHSNAGDEIVLETVQVGTAFGEVALYGGETRAAHAKASGATTLVRIERADMPAVLALCPALTDDLLSAMARRLRSSGDTLRRLATFDINTTKRRQMTRFDRVCVRIVDVLSSVPFLVAMVAGFMWWVVKRPFHDTTLDGLALTEGTIGFLITLLVLLGQKREERANAVSNAEESLAIRQAARELQYLHEKLDAALSRLPSPGAPGDG